MVFEERRELSEAMCNQHRLTFSGIFLKCAQIQEINFGWDYLSYNIVLHTVCGSDICRSHLCCLYMLFLSTGWLVHGFSETNPFWWQISCISRGSWGYPKTTPLQIPLLFLLWFFWTTPASLHLRGIITRMKNNTTAILGTLLGENWLNWRQVQCNGIQCL